MARENTTAFSVGRLPVPKKLRVVIGALTKCQIPNANRSEEQVVRDRLSRQRPASREAPLGTGAYLHSPRSEY